MSGTTSVFISYSRYDRDAAFAIKSLLEESNIRVWLDVISIKVSSQLLQELYDNIDRHETFCLLLSPTSVASPWCLKEVQHARSKENLRFVPVILRSCKIPTDLENVVALDAREGLDHASVRSRLLRALCGDGIVEDSIVFTQLQQDLLASNQILEEGESHLVDIKKQIAALSDEAITRLDLHIDVNSLPVDGEVIELRMELDMWKVGFSMFISLYREGMTWPERFEFEECEYTEFYRKKIPRVDVRFRWLKYTQKMHRTLTDDEHLAEFYMDFDSHDFRPGGTTSMPAKFEVPCLTELAKHWSKVDMFLHSRANETTQLITAETDINVEIFGTVCEHSIRLYRSSHSYKQEILAACPSVLAESNLIWKEVLVHGCDQNDTLKKLRAPSQDLRSETLEALNSRETNWRSYPFSSIDEQRRVAHALHSRGGQDHRIHSQYRDAFRRFASALDLFNYLIPLGPIAYFDVLTAVDCHYLMIESCLRERRFDIAVQLGVSLKNFLSKLYQANTHHADFAQLLADASLLHAEIMSNVKLTKEALSELDMSVKIYGALYKGMPLPKRRLAYIEVLQRVIRDSQLWNLGPSPLVEEWTAAIHQDVGSEIASKLLTFVDPDHLPTWLTPITLAAWPTSPIHNATLRYALNLPKRWIQKPLVRGTATQIEHIYWGNAAQDADWMCVDFMGNVQQGDHSYLWVDSGMLLAALPMAYIHTDQERGPKKRSWTYLGTIQGLKKRLKADEAYGWIGLFEYKREHIMLGRIYTLVIRRGRFAWKIVLSFATAVLEGMEEKMLESNDHVRAGAVLGSLSLDGIPEMADESMAAENDPACGWRLKDIDRVEISASSFQRNSLSWKGRRIGSLADAFSGSRHSPLPAFRLRSFYGYGETIDQGIESALDRN